MGGVRRRKRRQFAKQNRTPSTARKRSVRPPSQRSFTPVMRVRTLRRVFFQRQNVAAVIMRHLFRHAVMCAGAHARHGIRQNRTRQCSAASSRAAARALADTQRRRERYATAAAAPRRVRAAAAAARTNRACALHCRFSFFCLRTGSAVVCLLPWLIDALPKERVAGAHAGEGIGMMDGG